MTKAIHQIKQDLTKQEEIVGKVSIELDRLYAQYFNLLSKSIEKQLILLTYQICTSEYPEAFLSLSLNQRETLQQNLRTLGNKLKAELLWEKLREKESEEDDFESIMQQMSTRLPSTPEKEKSPLEEILSEEETLAELTSSIDAEIAENNDREGLEQGKPFNIRNPQELIDWHKQIQQRIEQVLKSISTEANQLLEEVNILPHKLPNKVIEMAIAAENNESTPSNYPNLLNLLVEAENKEATKEGKITKITVISLRLPEIEFSDPALSAQSNQIRNILAKIDKIRQQYQKKQRELSVAQAEAAWRSTWYED